MVPLNLFSGTLFFVFIALEKAFLQKWLDKAPAFLAHFYALAIIIPGWVIFYFTDTTLLLRTYKNFVFACRRRLFDIKTPRCTCSG
jgi:nucleoside recognition membrane protein YjiH